MITTLLLLATLLASADDPVTNNDILDLVGKEVSSKLIVAMIQNADTEFDTSTETILTLRDKGVPDEVLEAMINDLASFYILQVLKLNLDSFSAARSKSWRLCEILDQRVWNCGQRISLPCRGARLGSGLFERA